MSKASDKLKKLNMPVGKEIKTKLDTWLNENVNVPLSEKGYPDTGAALAAGLSATGELVIPDDLADVAMSLIPGAKIMRTGMKGYRKIRKAAPGLEKAGTINYGNIVKGEREALKKASKASEKNAHTLKYSKDGTITKKNPKKDVEDVEDLGEEIEIYSDSK